VQAYGDDRVRLFVTAVNLFVPGLNFFFGGYLSLDFFVVPADTFFGPACLDFPEPWPDPPFPAFGLG
jgi:hypothetical protein